MTADFWDLNIDRFSFTDEFPRKPRDVLCMKHIVPVPESTRDSLVNIFCPENSREHAKNYAANRD